MAKNRSDFYFPEELIFMVLSWLPVLSLLRFRSVCKSWRSMISNPQFIENHLANSHKKEAHVLRLATGRVHRAGAGGFDDSFYIDTRDVSFKPHLPPQFSYIKHFVISCNGLVCLSNRRADSIYLWNPLTRGIKKLPTPKIQASLRRCLGFCFNSISNDYKLLRIVLSRVKYEGSVTWVLEAELYSSDANSWKEIQVPKTVKIKPWPFAKYVDIKTGIMYFDFSMELLSFDSHNEVFRLYPFPEFVLNRRKSFLLHHRRKSFLLDFNGSVAMILESVCDGPVLSLWTLDDICGKVSWVKKFNLVADLGISQIALHLGAGQFVARYNTDARYFFYDYKKKKNEQVPLPHRLEDHVSVFKYNESLVSLEGFEQLD